MRICMCVRAVEIKNVFFVILDSVNYRYIPISVLYMAIDTGIHTEINMHMNQFVVLPKYIGHSPCLRSVIFLLYDELGLVFRKAKN